ncbi:hypothetical protein [Paenibacillus pinistramenti]|uniref:hypothetical protein n=1 Tax=Paenibacillus pinistramenti TaxID=1768003 RepID=UPI0011090E51|nr:hypothetical protein [Paenibacillus pinistramenti]
MDFQSWDYQVWVDYFKQNWLIIVVALVALFLVANLVKTVIKWVLILIIAAFLIVYSGVTLNDIGQAVSTVKDQTVDTMKSEALNLMKNEAKEAAFTQNPDGSFTIKTPNLEVTGESGSDKVKVSLHGVSLGEWSRSDTLEAFIQEAKSSSGQ